MSDIYLVRKDELYHYGIKGMKWGHRKKQINNAVDVARTRNANTINGKYNYKVQNLKRERDAAYSKATKEFKSDMKNLKRQGKQNDQKSLDAVYKKYDDKTNAAMNQYKSGKKQARGEAAQSRIDARGGSKGKAAAVSAGSMVARNMLRNAGAMAIGSLSGSETVANGAMTVAGWLNFADMVKTGVDIYDIAKR